ncbi:MAG TPA: hypothetical protein VKA02_03670 [Candidatus Acidoferrum sp.]|nr:hypothetical protein [Candidatus Acidoferrum sp.]
MLKIQGGCDEHDEFKELCALAASGSLEPSELPELQAHLKHCEACREVFRQYQILTTQGIAILADAYLERQAQVGWDGALACERLLARVRADQQAARERESPAPAWVPPDVLRRTAWGSFAKMALAACLILAVAYGAYHLGARTQTRTTASLTPLAVDNGLQKLSDEKKAADELSAAQAKRLAQLQLESSAKGQELAQLRSALRALEDHASELTAAGGQSEAQLRALAQQRDSLNAQLQALNQAYANDQTELASLRTERDTAVLRTSSLEAKIDDLTARNRDQQRRLEDTGQFLSYDRDIRELMGARKLYITDVFDVDGNSRTQKPFGRVFYTQGKSLIFYAFDLDREPGVVNASAFQVWGQREMPQGEQASPRNLGILYMDNESNRRWVMRFDDPKQLAEIDAVFVTVEPRGGSHKPTSKPFLYALLRNEANHP